MGNLAIVIPAYKSKFLKKTLQSLALQTCQQFTVYIGNDAGDEEITNIVSGFKNKLNIYYKYFPVNLGSVSLVKQWNRCLALTKDEDWCWILPDDDYVDPECVELFYQDVFKFDFDLFRFNIHFVTSDDIIFKTNPPLELLQNSYDSLIEKLSFKRPSSIAEFIFRKKKYDYFGFIEIPMAWGSDDLFWFLVGKDKGIRSSNDAFVYLRQSEFNISNNYTDLGTKKIDANFIFFEKLLEIDDFKNVIITHKLKEKFREVSINFIMYNLQDFSLQMSLKKCFEYSVRANHIWGGGVLRNMRRFCLNNYRIAKEYR